MPAKGQKHSEESRRRMSEAAKNRPRRRHSQQTRRKMAEARRLAWLRPDYRGKVTRSLLGHHVSEYVREAVRKANTGQGWRNLGYKHTEATKAKLKAAWTEERKDNWSKELSHRFLEGRWHPVGSTVGFYFSRKNGQEVQYRSKLELKWYQVLECLFEVKSYQPEPCTIRFEFGGRICRYTPDIRVVYKNGSVEIWECKPEFRWEEPRNKAKFEAGRRYCDRRKRPTTFRVVGYKDLPR